MKIKTELLKEMISAAVKGAGNNKFLPITELIGIKAQDNILSLTCTDATNYIEVSEPVECEPFYAAVNADIFAKLVGKITSNETEITVTENAVIIKGNGEYKIGIQLDEDGKAVKFENKFNADDDIWKVDKQTIKTETIERILNVNKSALATTLELPCYTGYYCGKDVVSTDTYKITVLDTNIFDEPCLISPQVMELLSVFKGDDINVYTKDDIMIFVDEKIKIFTHKLAGIEDFAIDSINRLMDSEFEKFCTFNRQAMINLLDRISLFVGPYDNNAVMLNFTDKGIQVSSRQSNGVEIIPYAGVSDVTPYQCSIDVNLLMTQLKSQTTDITELWYGNDKAIKMCSDDVTQIVCLIEIND